MSKTIKLSVLDQTPMRQGSTASVALRETVKLAQATERMGYMRFWVSEHHNSIYFAGTNPEILIGQIAANTETIRVGSAGVMLPHYSSLKVAEGFSVLESFYPGRIDLGVGRAPGSDQLTATALSYPKPQANIATFPQQVLDLIGYLSGTLAKDHPFERIRSQPGPVPDNLPEIWILGSSNYSAGLAAELGLPFAFADFFGSTREQGPAAAAIYRKGFKPSPICHEPKLNVGFQVICAPTKEEAEFIGASRNINKAREVLRLGLGPGMISPEKALDLDLAPGAKSYIEQLSSMYIDGDPKFVKTKILELTEEYDTTDITIVTNCYDFRHRVRSYELLAEAFEMG